MNKDDFKQLQDMAFAHLQHVAQTITDLKTQQENIENQISKLTNYYKEKLNFLNTNTLEQVSVD